MKPSKIIDQLQDNTRVYEGSLRAAERALTEANTLELKLEQGILEQLGQIASIQLGEGTALSHEVTTTLATRQSAIEHLRSSLTRTESEIGEALDERRIIKDQVDDTEGLMLKALGSNTAFQSAVEARNGAQLAVSLAHPAYAEIKAEVEAKLPAFRASRLFCYLECKQFGTTAYQGGKLSRFIDRWISSRANYPQNKAAYDTLQALAAANEQGMATLKARVEQDLAAVDQLRQQAAVEHKLDAIQIRLESADQKIADLKAKANSTHQQLDQFAVKGDVYYRKAHDLMVGVLQRKSIQELLAHCETTEAPEDDAHAVNVRNLYGRLREVRDSIPRLRAEREQQGRQYERAKDIERKLRDSRYNSSNYRYSDSLDLDSLLIGYMAGSLTSDSVTSQVESSASRIPEPAGNGGFGGNLLDTTSSIGGGGFSTTDSF